MHPNTKNATKDEFRVQWGGLGAFVVKILTRLRGTNFCSNKMVPNAHKHYETHQNMSLGSDGVDRVDMMQKILTQLCGLNFCINFNSSARFEQSIVKQWNVMSPAQVGLDEKPNTPIRIP